VCEELFRESVRGIPYQCVRGMRGVCEVYRAGLDTASGTVSKMCERVCGGVWDGVCEVCRVG
jgi:hypothetical protein